MKTKSQKNERSERLTTPIGVAVYPWLSKPDDKYDDEGVYSVRLRIPEEEAQELQSQIQEAYDEAYKAACSREGTRKLKTDFLPWRQAVDEDGKETGEIEFNFKSKASGINKETKEAWTRKVPLFDSKRKPLDSKKVLVGTGSRIKVSFFISPWYTKKFGFGVTLRLVGVQIVELVAGGGNNAEAMGFGEEEGWEGDEADEVTTSKEDGDESTEESDDEELDLTDDDEDEAPPVKTKAKATTKAKPKAAAKAKPKSKTKPKSKAR